MKRKNRIIAIVMLLLISLPAITKAQQVELPNYVKALGLKNNVKSIGVFTEDFSVSCDYCTFEFGSSGNLISYSEAEMVEGAYSRVAYFDSDGLPTHLETEFIDYWTEPDADGNPPVTNNRYNIRKEQNGPVVKLFIEVENGGEIQVNVARDDKGRIIEVEKIHKGETFRYRYPDNTNVPYHYDGTLAFPQVDMVEGYQIEFPSQQNIPNNPTTFTYGIWEFEVIYHDN
ncbi:MAG: hypothetical protein IKW85_10430 [Muribaculaceae bacterium]|nr:hypothetical protein [Muribaculaceae bacterium]